jgi:hypothetical protein
MIGKRGLGALNLVSGSAADALGWERRSPCPGSDYG